jgi:hypothetical protein
MVCIALTQAAGGYGVAPPTESDDYTARIVMGTNRSSERSSTALSGTGV